MRERKAKDRYDVQSNNETSEITRFSLESHMAEKVTTLSIENMDCPTEEKLIRTKLDKIDGVASLDFNLIQRKLKVGHGNNVLPEILAALKSLGFEAKLQEEGSAEPSKPKSDTTLWALTLSGIMAALSEFVYWFNGDSNWLVILLASVAIAGGGLPTYKKGWIALKNFNLNINALMSIAVTGAVLIGHWPEAAMVMVLFALAEVIEAKSLDRARNAIRGLMDLAPEQATIQQQDGSWEDIDAKSVTIGSLARVKPGERIALDGVVMQGFSTVDQALITGESLPIEKAEGDLVFAGTVNQSGSLEYKVTSAASDSTLARILHAVEDAQGSRAPTQRFVDKFARIYTPVIFILALMVAVFPPLLFEATWLDSVYKALVLLVIACPCALVISTPVTIVSGLAAAARHGILIKGGVYLEDGRKLKWLALDKTGTLTHGKPVQTEVMAWGGADPTKTQQIAASLGDRSDHPVSRAIALVAKQDGLRFQDVGEFMALPGRGVRGVIEGRTYHLGNLRLLKELGVITTEFEATLFALEKQGKTVVMLVNDGNVEALFAVADTVKETSREAVAELHALGVSTMMLTGDNAYTAASISNQVGIDRIKGNLLPEDKLREVELLSAEGKTGMVGDGINDAPAMARADIGFAMGAAGTDTAIETADVALMDDDLRKIPTFIRLSRTTAHVLTQNIALALGIKAVFLVLTITGDATMWMAVFADMGASLLVVGNGLRLLRK
ncbi:heavy metal translocating P-type ATPase [Sneathiella aquimaris]|uniref:heavy metal translocating P-type ATPase n=1 Tax=Sneathiella aquimaris TaxID=2599305 RepID=UPI00146C13BC|nr:heavy metal translocating P-type ATPase [Sneathiella aquimaris]